jgi:hypothetical protein
VDVVGERQVGARIEAALAEAKVKRLGGDPQGAREVVLSILAVDEEHAEARRLLAELERPSPPPARQPPPDGSAWPAMVAVTEAAPPLREPRSPRVPAPRAAVRPRARGLSPMGIGAIVLGAAVLVVGVIFWTRSTPARDRPLSPGPAPSSAQAVRPAEVRVVAEAPPATVASPAASLVNEEVLRRTEGLLARGDYAAAERAVKDGLRSQPSDAKLRALQERVLNGARRAADAARTSLGEARAAAEKARAGERAPRVFQQARDLEAEMAALYGRQLWTEALAKADAATAAYQEAQTQARAETARTAYEQVRARAVEAGAERLAPRPFTEAVAHGARAQAAWDRRELEAATGEFDWAASTMEQARREAANAAAAAAPPAPTPPSLAGGEAEREAILAVIRRYTAAMEARDFAALKAVWPGVGGAQEAKIRAGFQFAKSVRVQIDVTGVQITHGTAVVSCRRKDTVVTTEGRTAQNAREAVIRLEKTDGWSIVAVQ